MYIGSLDSKVDQFAGEVQEQLPGCTKHGLDMTVSREFLESRKPQEGLREPVYQNSSAQLSSKRKALGPGGFGGLGGGF